MTLIAYKEQRFAKKTMVVINRAVGIIEEMAEQGYTLTLRQIFYQFVSKNWLPNTEQSYNRLGETISNARLAGLISWDAVEDRTRFIRERDQWNRPQDFVRDSRKWFHIPMWENQDYYLEVWSEKDALLGVIQQPCWEMTVPYMACRGYMSQSEEWQAAQRFEAADSNGKMPVLIYLGDHDPSGIDMTRDHEDRLTMFLEHLGITVDVRRIALNIDQVREYNPPPNPTKIKDSRSPDYIKKFGRDCWELDALKPKVIDDLIRKTIDEYRDPDKWQIMLDRLAVEKSQLRQIGDLGIAAFEEEQRKAAERREEAEDQIDEEGDDEVDEAPDED